ncbi:MAG: lipopolysaccharide biosynthesis protein [Telluria sp.]
MAGSHPYAASRIVLQAKWFAIAKVGIAIVSLLTQFVLVRHLDVVNYASYTIYVAGTGVLVFLTMFGMDRVIYRFLPPLREHGRWREALGLMAGLLLARLVLMGLILLVLWAGARVLLPAQLVDQLSSIPGQTALYALAQAANDSLLIFCNGVGQQRSQAGLYMAAGAVRLAAVTALVLSGPLTAVNVADVFAFTELALTGALAAVLAVEFARLRTRGQRPGPWQFGFGLRELCRDAFGTQAAYLLGLPFKGVLLKLIVGAVATPLVTASFGFFQTLSDRAYQFMPVFLLKGILEPALASDYAVRGSTERVRLTVSMLLRVNFTIVALGVALLLGVGAPLIDWITQGRYGDQVPLAVLIALQVTGLTLGESMFFALNPVGRVSRHNKLWLWFAVPFLALLGAAAWTRNAYVLVLAATLPYYLVYAWLRFVDREPSLQDGLGLDPAVLLRLATVALLAAAAGRVLLLLPAGHAATVCAALGVMAAFVLALRATGLFNTRELASIGQVSPRLAQLVRPFAAA